MHHGFLLLFCQRESDAVVEACLLRAMQRIRFPSPTGGGVVIVNYPLLFNPGR
jgi:hypothetical protein